CPDGAGALELPDRRHDLGRPDLVRDRRQAARRDRVEEHDHRLRTPMMIRVARLVLLLGAAFSGAAVAQDRDAKGSFAVRRDFSLMVPAADGTKLATDVYRPDTPNRVPALLVRTPYNRTGLGSYREGHYWASHGYAYVVQDVRGRGDSEGHFDPLVAEGSDGYRAQSWIARQPWSNGRVGTLGGSYLGWTQVFTAP